MDTVLTASQHLQQGAIVAYPTEAVYGLGCDPMNEIAVMRLLKIKQRAVAKGLILIAADIKQLEPYIDTDLLKQFPAVLDSWPGPNTWLIPCRDNVPTWIRGQHETLALRITAHAMSAKLCNTFGGAIISTSANISDQPPALNAAEVERQLGEHMDYILHGETDSMNTVTSIRDARTGKQLR